MELDQIIEEAKTKAGCSQNKLAESIGMNRSNLSQVMHRRRALPAEAAIELSELTGYRAKAVWEAAQRWARSESKPCHWKAAHIRSCSQ